ncbi:MAG: winged helix-turn-helix domain-containing protein [Holophagales bacterium]|nr:winged helix-turn-helix domain-containing protein [Holophagales bacterium]
MRQSENAEVGSIVLPGRVVDRIDRAVRHADGETVGLHPKALRVLAHLVERFPDVAPKEELLSRVWENRFVGEEVLTNAVYELRQALRDDARKPTFIKTVHGEGYQLLVVPEVHHPEPRLSRRSTLWLSAIACLVAGGIGTGFFLLRDGDSSSPDDPARHQEAERHFRIGKSLVARRSYIEAIERLNAAKELVPDDSRFWDALANVYDIQGDRRLALEYVEVAIAKAPGELDRTRYRRRKAQILGDLDSELELLQKGYRLDPADPFWSSRLGWFYFEHRRDCAKALMHYARSIELEVNPDILSYWVEASVRCDELESARRLLDDYLALVPESSDALELASELSWRSGEHEASLASLAASVELDPGFLEGWLELAEKSRALGRLGEARSHALRFRTLAEDPAHQQQAFEVLGLIELTSGEVDVARRWAERALEVRDPTLRTLWVEGWIALSDGDTAEFHGVLEKAKASPEAKSGSRHRAAYLALLEARAAALTGDVAGAFDRLGDELLSVALDPGFLECESRAISDLAEEEPDDWPLRLRDCLQWAGGPV